jgi:hypothetical protein
VLLAPELLHGSLVELPALRCQRDHAVLRERAVDTFQGCGDDVDAQDHSRAAAVRLVVHLPAGERRPVAIVVEPQVELTAEDGGDWALL